MARGARRWSLELVEVAGGVSCLLSKTKATLLDAKIQTKSVSRCARCRRTCSCDSETEGNTRLTEFCRRSWRRRRELAVLDGVDDLGQYRMN